MVSADLASSRGRENMKVIAFSVVFFIAFYGSFDTLLLIGDDSGVASVYILKFSGSYQVINIHVSVSVSVPIFVCDYR